MPGTRIQPPLIRLRESARNTLLPRLVLRVLFAVTAATALAAPQARAAGVHPEDWRFMRTMAEIGHAEVIAGKLALTNAGDASVRELGKQLMQDNMQGDRRLDLLALDTQIPVPSRPARAERKELGRLKLLHGEAFDRAYLSGPGTALQQQELAFLRKEAGSQTLHPGLRHLAQKRLPELEATLASAERLQARHAR